jgi:hypothetical protein
MTSQMSDPKSDCADCDPADIQWIVATLEMQRASCPSEANKSADLGKPDIDGSGFCLPRPG